MKEKKIMKIIQKEVKTGRENGDNGDVILARITKQVSDVEKLNDCLQMYLFVQEVYDAMRKVSDLVMYDAHLYTCRLDYNDFLCNNYSWGIKDYKRFLKYFAELLRDEGYRYLYIIHDNECDWFFVDREMYERVRDKLIEEKYSYAGLWSYDIRMLVAFDRVYRAYKNHTLDVEHMTCEELGYLQAIKGKSCSNEVDTFARIYEQLEYYGWLDALDIEKIKELYYENDIKLNWTGFYYISNKQGRKEFCNVF